MELMYGRVAKESLMMTGWVAMTTEEDTFSYINF